MLDALLRWWATEMLGWLPTGLLGRAGDGADALVAEAVPDGRGAPRLRLFSRRNGHMAELGELRPGGTVPAATAPFRRGTAVFRVPPGAWLERAVTLPAAAERNLHQVLAYEMDRLTPFKDADVHWGWTVAGRDRARNQVSLRLMMVPKARVDAFLAMLDAAGLRTGAIEAPDPGAAPRRIALHGAAPARALWRRRALAALGTACALLAVAALVLPFALQSVRLAAAERRIAALAPEVREAETLRRRLASGGADRDVLVAERARVGDALGVLAAMTAVLPDDTYLTDFTLRGGQVMVSGQSGSAVRLIGIIAADPTFRNPAFTAPVTRTDGRARRDVFSLRADASPAADGR